jgi:hypothetical protein
MGRCVPRFLSLIPYGQIWYTVTVRMMNDVRYE